MHNGLFQRNASPFRKSARNPSNGRENTSLNDFLTSTKSIDATVQGRIFTWKKFSRGQPIFEKLDRVIFREDCEQLFPDYIITNGPFMCSDHAFVCLDTAPPHQPRRGTNFKYQHFWAQYQDTHSLVKKNWRMGVRGTPMYRITQ